LEGEAKGSLEPELLKPVSLWCMFKIAISKIPHFHFEYISNTFISPLARDLVSNATQVGLIQALNPLFGILVQPLIGWRSDHTWTRLGRRKPYVLFALPWLLVSLALMPLTHSLWLFVLAVLIYQLFVDLNAVSVWAIMPETVPLEQRSRQSSVEQLFNAAVMMVALIFIGPRYDTCHLYPFAFCIALTIACTSVTLFGIKEHYREVRERPQLRFVPFLRAVVDALFRDRNIWLYMLAVACSSYGANTVTTFYTLFVSRTLGSTVGKAVFIMFVGPIVTLLVALPLGLLADRFSKKKVLLFSYAVSLVSYVIGLTASSSDQMYGYWVFAALAGCANSVSGYALLSQFMPPTKVGIIGGAIPLFYGSARLVTMVTTGAIIDAFGENYRVIWWIAIACITPCIVLVSRIDESRGARQPLYGASAQTAEIDRGAHNSMRG